MDNNTRPKPAECRLADLVYPFRKYSGIGPCSPNAIGPFAAAARETGSIAPHVPVIRETVSLTLIKRVDNPSCSPPPRLATDSWETKRP